MLKSLRNLVSPPDVLARSSSATSRQLLRDAPPAVEQRAALLAGKNVPYTLKRSSRRRSIGLRVDDRGLTVCIPARTSEKWLHSVLQEKAGWVLEKLDGWKSRRPAAMRWEDGDKIHYKGELLTLRVVQSLFAAPAHRYGNELRLFVVNDRTAAHIKQTVQRWYRNEAEQLFVERVAHYAQLLYVAPREVKLSAAKTQWGSCTPQGSVRLNVQLIKLPPPLIDYVVVHELAHLREMNHSAAFWRVVGSVCAEYPGLRKELRKFSLCAD